MPTYPRDTFVSKRGPSALEVAFKRLEDAFLAKQTAFHSLVVRAQGRSPEVGDGFLICNTTECSKVPSLEQSLKNGEVCPSCGGDLVERRAPHLMSDDMDDDERKRRGVAVTAKGVPFGAVKQRIKSVKSAHGGRLNGRRI